ncbi:MBL fold metallo-hydrolase [Herbaspirillum sp. HC18]|nr:MBL fold metallo-hydrolase [Herbaspirillum sp. HC18]
MTKASSKHRTRIPNACCRPVKASQKAPKPRLPAQRKKKMQLEIFDVEHGACALLTCDDGKRMLIDCGHNASTSWQPGTTLRRRGVKRIDMLTVTNYDEDHVSGLPNLLDNVDVGWLWRNKSVTPETLKKLKSEDGMGPGIDALVGMAQRYTGGNGNASPEFPGVVARVFCNHYPKFDDENNLSLVLHLTIDGVGFLFPGDLEKAGWETLLKENAGFREAVKNTHVLVASHHGRENGICDDIFEKYGCKPIWVVISDKGYKHDTQLTVPYYKSKARGGSFRGEDRWVLTTRNDGTIIFWFDSGKWGAK